MKPSHPSICFNCGILRIFLPAFLCLAGNFTRAAETAPSPSSVAQPAIRGLPAGVIPGALPGSPPQAPDTSNFDYTSLFHDLLDDNPAGFVQIFDGKTLTGWDGDPTYWRVENGVIVGESTPGHLVKDNTFLIWRGGRTADFELKIDFRLGGVNSGIQYRSVELPAIGKWVLKGYQADMDSLNGFTGNIHEERGRDLLVQRGNIVRAEEGGKYTLVGKIGEASDLRGSVNVGNWNRYHIIARGPILMQFLNGRLMAVLIDEDTKNRTLDGVLGLQMHVGPPFKVEYRNIWYRKL
ncbi:MAG: hypothetical protein RL077_2349 [Verrucomicrobiota bacterium]|jgi:hypothetical protein